jgi:imidazolonepropionase-like amidohydrolase
MANAKRLSDAGVLLAAGTDSPYPGDYYGEGLHRELELLVEAGLTPLQAIRAATATNADILGG